MKKILALLVATAMGVATAGPASAATPPTYGDALDCLFGGLTNGPDSDPDMVAGLMLVFEAAGQEAAGDYEEAMELLEDAVDLLDDADDAPVDCTGAVVASGRDLAAYTVELWAEAGASKKDLKHVNKHLAKGDKHLAKGKLDKAMKEYEKALEHAVEGLEDD